MPELAYNPVGSLSNSNLSIHPNIMSRTSDHYPQIFREIPDAVHKLKEFRIECESGAEARSIKTHWYGYVRTLRKEQHHLAIGSSTVLVRVEGSTVIFVDRNQDRMALRIREALASQLGPQFTQEQIELEIAEGKRNPDGSLKG